MIKEVFDASCYRASYHFGMLKKVRLLSDFGYFPMLPRRVARIAQAKFVIFIIIDDIQ